MKHALFVAFHYPPEASSSGVLRTLKFTRYLEAHGWRVTVLTVRQDAYEVVDEALERQVPSTVRVVRTAYVNTKRHLSIGGRHLALMAIPDSWVGWWPWGVRAGRRILREDPADLIYSTSPHATAHLIAGSLARYAGIPWVVDFRDPWYEDAPGIPAVVKWSARRLEGRAIKRAACVIGTTRRLTDAIAARHPEEPREKFVMIPNGFDEADFATAPAAKPRTDGNLLIVHAGGLHPGFRDPRPIFAAVAEAGRAGAVDPKRIVFRFLGGGAFGQSEDMTRALAETGLSSTVEFLDRVPYQEALAELSRADVLLLLQASPDTADMIPAKLFEYLRSRRPVLALVEPGASNDVLNEVGGGWAVDPREPAQLRATLVTAWQAWRDGGLDALTARPERLEAYTRERLTAELAARFNALVRPAKA